MSFEMLNEKPLGTVIKVIGVGGAGGNAVQHMIDRGVKGVEFICANTDAQVLNKMTSTHKIQLGDSGLGAGARPEVGRAAAEENRERISDLIGDANMVFITAGMGGGTGTGAAPVFAEVAKQMGILTVAVVSKPFSYEGQKRMRIAELGLEELERHVDSLIVVLNDKLEEMLGEDASMADAFEAADNVLNNAVAGIAEIINVDGHINVDFNDVKTVMGEQGRAMMGTAVAAGAERARAAAEEAVASPLLDGVNLAGARGILINISASRDSLKQKEIREVVRLISDLASEEATIIYGLSYDEGLGDKIRVTVVATGLGGAKNINRMPQMGGEFSHQMTDNMTAGAMAINQSNQPISQQDIRNQNPYPQASQQQPIAQQPLYHTNQAPAIQPVEHQMPEFIYATPATDPQIRGAVQTGVEPTGYERGNAVPDPLRHQAPPQQTTQRKPEQPKTALPSDDYSDLDVPAFLRRTAD